MPELIAAYTADHGVYTIDAEYNARYMNGRLAAQFGALYRLVELGQGADLHDAQVLVAKHHLLGERRPV